MSFTYTPSDPRLRSSPALGAFQACIDAVLLRAAQSGRSREEAQSLLRLHTAHFDDALEALNRVFLLPAAGHGPVNVFRPQNDASNTAQQPGPTQPPENYVPGGPLFAGIPPHMLPLLRAAATTHIDPGLTKLPGGTWQPTQNQDQQQTGQYTTTSPTGNRDASTTSDTRPS